VEITSTAYGIRFSSDPIDLGGSSNLNLHVCDGSDCYVVRSYRPYVTADRLREIHSVRQQLAADGIPCGGLVPTTDGRPWIDFEGRLVEVERYVEHDADMDSWDRLESGMFLLGRMHIVLRALEVGEGAKSPMFANHVSSAEIRRFAARSGSEVGTHHRVSSSWRMMPKNWLDESQAASERWRNRFHDN
jgi:Ser/Thr protein kinase RdoA (MazF antagonist)